MITTPDTGSIPTAEHSPAPPAAVESVAAVTAVERARAVLVKALESHAGRYGWVAAVSWSQIAASLELAMGADPVMVIGGFDNGSGDLTLSQSRALVRRGWVFSSPRLALGLTASLTGLSG